MGEYDGGWELVTSSSSSADVSGAWNQTVGAYQFRVRGATSYGHHYLRHRIRLDVPRTFKLQA